MADIRDLESPPLTLDDLLPATAAYLVGFVVVLFIEFVHGAVVPTVAWSLIGLFVAYGVARLAARWRTESEINRRNSAWIAEHRHVIELLGAQRDALLGSRTPRPGGTTP